MNQWSKFWEKAGGSGSCPDLDRGVKECGSFADGTAGNRGRKASGLESMSSQRGWWAGHLLRVRPAGLRGGEGLAYLLWHLRD